MMVVKYFDINDKETVDPTQIAYAVRLILDDNQRVLSHTVFRRKTNGTTA